MILFLARRLGSGACVLLVIAVLVFVLVRLAPGGPFDEDREPPPDVRAALNARWHMNEPLYKQFEYYFRGLVRGDLGPSMSQLDWTVGEIVVSSFPVSAALAALALAWAVPLGLWLGASAAA
ncbi:MAG: oligopeptide transporter permease, partial [Planctomycetes bacterium]|nr:oligopeptide transporter permease [Planctomycetota bacterium]